jgi:hypothetical protein
MANFLRKAIVIAVLAVARLAFAVIFAGVFVIAEHDHVHVDNAVHRVPSGENCRICFEIQIALRLMEAFGRLGVIIAVTGFVFFISTDGQQLTISNALGGNFFTEGTFNKG